MTRDQAKSKLMEMTDSKCTERWMEDFIDSAKALGILKLDEPKNLPQRLRDFVSDSRLVQGTVMERLGNLQDVLQCHGLKILEA